MRLVETRLLEGPNVYRLEPVVKLEFAIGRRRTWYGQRDPGRHALVHLGADVPARDWPDPIAATVAWIRRLRTDHGEGRSGLAVHRSSDPGHWIITFPWTGAERAQTLSEAALALAERDVSPSRTAQLTGAQERLLARWTERIEAARATPPEWLRDADRRIPIVSISGTNGKSTVTRLMTHILARAGRQVGTTTSDGVLVDERMVEPGDWTGPGGAHQVLARRDVDVAVLETARGGIVLRGVGYESNDASVLTNVSSDHLDLQGIHTLPELAEVKSTICRITKPDGWVVLNADDPLVAAVARRVEGQRRAVHARGRRLGDGPRAIARGGGRAYLVRDGQIIEANGASETPIVEVAMVPITIGGLARHNVANALAAAGGARGLGATIEQVRDGLIDFAPSAESSPGRLNLFRLGSKVVIVDFAHNEAGIGAVLDVAQGIAGGAAGRAAPITAIIGTAGDRPDDTLRGIGRIAAERAQRVAIKQTLKYLRGRTAESVVGELMVGVVAGGCLGRRCPDLRLRDRVALQAELNGAAGAGADGGRSDAARVIVLMCHEDRDGVFELLRRLGARPVDVATELTELVPRMQGRPRTSEPVSWMPPGGCSCERGYHGVTIDEIAKEAGVSRQAVYAYHFGSKSDFLIALLVHVEAVEGIAELLRPSDDAESGVEALHEAVKRERGVRASGPRCRDDAVGSAPFRCGGGGNLGRPHGSQTKRHRPARVPAGGRGQPPAAMDARGRGGPRLRTSVLPGVRRPGLGARLVSRRLRSPDMADARVRDRGGAGRSGEHDSRRSARCGRPSTLSSRPPRRRLSGGSPPTWPVGRRGTRAIPRLPWTGRPARAQPGR